jgi:hypothetical protein
MINSLLVENSHSSSQEDRQPTVQALTAYSAHLLSRLANDLLAAEPRDVSAGLRVIRDELLALATAIRELEPGEGSLDWLLAECDQRLPNLTAKNRTSSTPAIAAGFPKA